MEARRYMVTTQSKHRFTVYTNKLMNASIERPHQAWVCDITYLRIRKGFVYLFLLTRTEDFNIVIQATRKSWKTREYRSIWVKLVTV